MAVVAVPSAAVAAAGPVDPTTIKSAIDKVFSDLNRTDSPGCALGIVNHGLLTYARGYGMASLEGGVAIDENTVFYSGSVSKQFAAAAILMAARQGYLSLDDDIRKFVPEVPDYGPTITIRHLVHHTSGLRDYLGLMALSGTPFENVSSRERVIDLISRQKALNFEPGDQYLYSNSGYFLLAEIVGRATDSSLREYTERVFFQPLGMRSTHFHDDRHHVVQRRALGYGQSSDAEGGFVVDWSPAFDQVGSGGLLTTIVDLARWANSFHATATAAGDIGPEFWQAMQQVGKLNSGEDQTYAFGLTLDEYQGRQRVQHGGAMFGYRAQLSFFPETDLSIAILCNLAQANPGRRADQISELLFGDVAKEGQPVAGKTEQGNVPPQKIELESARLAAFAGEYMIVSGLSIELASQNASLLATLGDDAPLRFDPVASEDAKQVRFVVAREANGSEADGLSSMTIELDDNNQATALVLDLIGSERRAERQAATVTSPDALQSLAGRYYSEELNAVATIELHNSPDASKNDRSLIYRIGTVDPEPVRLRADGSFQIPGMEAQTRAAKDGRIDSFVIDAGRVQGIEFVRLP